MRPGVNVITLLVRSAVRSNARLGPADALPLLVQRLARRGRAIDVLAQSNPITAHEECDYGDGLVLGEALAETAATSAAPQPVSHLLAPALNPMNASRGQRYESVSRKRSGLNACGSGQ